MRYDKFLIWLLQEKKLSQRSAKDVVSRCKRVCLLLGIDLIDHTTLAALNNNCDFLEKSMFIKSQLRRATALWIEFGGTSHA